MISHKHKCIFIHIPKTAGMSIEDSFIRSLGLKFFKGQCPPLLLSYNQDQTIGPRSLAHLIPGDYVNKSYLSQELFDQYYKFSFVRNPWARAVSIYKYFQYHRILTFTDFMRYRFPELWESRYDFVRPQVDFLYNNLGEQVVDFIGKFENLKEDFEIVRKQLAHPVEDLSHINKPPQPHNWYSRWNRRFLFAELKEHPHLLRHINLFSPVQATYNEYYTRKAHELVENYYRKDIEILGYEF
ncbi:sulfotransferase family protein [Salinimicrobium sp. CDJ15-81-2]|nr:sulfotransferase family protein [Salinimicrobium nanhaiense]